MPVSRAARGVLASDDDATSDEEGDEMMMHRDASPWPRRPRVRQVVLGALALAWLGTAAAAEGPSTLVLEFELNDLTLYPNVEQEMERVSVLRPLLVEELEVRHDRPVAALPAGAATESGHGAGYVFDRPEVAARLAREAGADTVVSGRLHKASHLFVYLKAQLIDAADARVIADYVVEIKGWGEKLTAKGVEALGVKIDATLDGLDGTATPSTVPAGDG